MDFELYGPDFVEVSLSGKIDGPGDEKINIIFKQAEMISCRSYFTYEGGTERVNIDTGTANAFISQDSSVRKELEAYVHQPVPLQGRRIA